VIRRRLTEAAAILALAGLAFVVVGPLVTRAL
jgi:hypothetical protein